MADANYCIIPNGNGWTIAHDGQQEGEYASKEAAFEAAVGAASNAIKAGDNVTISVPGRHVGGPALGTAG